MRRTKQQNDRLIRDLPPLPRDESEAIDLSEFEVLTGMLPDIPESPQIEFDMPGVGGVESPDTDAGLVDILPQDTPHTSRVEQGPHRLDEVRVPPLSARDIDPPFQPNVRIHDLRDDPAGSLLDMRVPGSPEAASDPPGVGGVGSADEMKAMLREIRDVVRQLMVEITNRDEGPTRL